MIRFFLCFSFVLSFSTYAAPTFHYDLSDLTKLTADELHNLRRALPRALKLMHQCSEADKAGFDFGHELMSLTHEYVGSGESFKLVTRTRVLSAAMKLYETEMTVTTSAVKAPPRPGSNRPGPTTYTYSCGVKKSEVLMP